MQIPTLHTDRLLLLPPDAHSAALYQRFYTDAAASGAYGGPLSPGAAWARLASDVGSWHLLGFGVWVVHELASAQPQGVCGFWQGLGWPCELTWWLLPEARGRGIALEASGAAIACAYDTWGWDAVHTYLQDDNPAARALALRLGGRRVARPRFPDGLERDLFHLPRGGGAPAPA